MGSEMCIRDRTRVRVRVLKNMNSSPTRVHCRTRVLHHCPDVRYFSILQSVVYSQPSYMSSSSLCSRIILQALQSIDDVNCHRVTSLTLWRHVTRSVTVHANRSEVVVELDKDLVTRFRRTRINVRSRGQRRATHPTRSEHVQTKNHILFTRLFALQLNILRKKPSLCDPYL